MTAVARLAWALVSTLCATGAGVILWDLRRRPDEPHQRADVVAEAESYTRQAAAASGLFAVPPPPPEED